MDKFYFGFCNRTIWPLFHYLPSYVAYDADYWDSYQYVNEVYFQSLQEVVQPDDVVWVQDYHLMLLPKLLRERFPTLRIGFFLHIPFPSYELYRLLPRVWGREILDGLLERICWDFISTTTPNTFCAACCALSAMNTRWGL